MENKQQNKIRASRIPVSIEAVYEFRGFKDRCTIIDISETGMRLEVRQILLPGDVIKVTFPIIYDKIPLNIEAWCIVRNSSGNEIGVEYDELSNENKRKLISYVEQLLLKHGKSKYEPY
ncbi:MAG: PilZ domain-containing protein [Spirochaetes bacterium]|nr:PilZ domain-containing protein [Spirochaetota bacterium]